MRNGRAKGARLGTLHINVNPLVVARRLSELVDLFLCDGGPVADSDFLAQQRHQVREVFKGFHAANVANGKRSVAIAPPPRRQWRSVGAQRLRTDLPCFAAVTVRVKTHCGKQQCELPLTVQPATEAFPLRQIFLDPTGRHIKQGQAPRCQMNVVLRVAQIAQHRQAQ